MPFRTTKRRRFIRRTRRTFKRRHALRRPTRRFKRRGGAANLNRLTLRSFPGITWPAMLRTKLQYVDYVGLTSATEIAFQQYRGNSLYDPDLTGIGHQARGLDQLAGLYNRYYVAASKITVRCIVNTGNANVVCAIRAFNGVGTPAEAVIDQVMEARDATYIFVQQQSNSRIIKRYATTAGVYGESRTSVRNDKDEWGATTTANPGTSYQWTWTIHTQNADLATSTNVRIWVKIVYYCVFYGRINPPQS